MLVCSRGVRLAATARYLPDRVVTNDDLVKQCGLPVTAAWIQERTGIRERRWLEDGRATSDMVAEVVRRLCDRAGVAPDRLSRLIVATTSPDFPTPSCACVAQGKLGVESRFPCFDVGASCAGFIYALEVGAQAVLAGDELVAVVAAETRSRFLNRKDRSTAVLFGDGAGGVLLTPGEAGKGLLGVATFAEGAGYATVLVPAGGSARPASHETVDKGEHGLLMADGAKVYVAAVEGMLEATGLALAGLGLGLDDVHLLIPHQANGLMLAEVQKRLKLPDERLYRAVEVLGNTSSSAVPICLDWALEQGRIPAGSLVSLTAVGGGHTAGSAVVRF